MRRFGSEEERAVLEVLRRDPVCLSGYYKNPRGGPSVQQFEENLQRYFGAKHAVVVSSGTAALHVALLACGVKAGDEVITTPLSFSATATSILMCGARPVFVDVDQTYNIDPRKIGDAITDKTVAILPVHLLGTPCNMDPIMEVAEKYDLRVIEDNAQCFGGKYRGRKTGTIGHISIVSLQETKSITTVVGEGGACITGDDKLAEKCGWLRNHGQQYGGVPYLCYNFRMGEAAAAFGSVQLKKLDEFNSIQRRNAEILFEHLPDGVLPPHIPDYAEPTLYIVGCLAGEEFLREKFVEDMTKIGVNKNIPGNTVGLGYTRTLMELPLLKPFKRPCPLAEELVRHFLWFDVHRWKSEEEMTKIAEQIHGAGGRAV